jgi:cobalt/nickel transport system permease protein
VYLGIAYGASAIIGVALCVVGAWLLGKLLAGKGTRKKTGGFIERSLVGIVSLLKETVSNDEIASRKGFLQKTDPRLKILSIALLLISVLSTKSIAELCGMYGATLALALASAIGPGFFLKRTLLFVPVFSLFFVVPAIFNVVTPGEPVFAFTLFSHSLSITRQGIGSAAIFFMRVLDSVSIAILLVLTTRHHVLLKVLRIFKAPRIFVMTMGMTYRYIYLLLDIVQNTFVAVRSRVGFVTSAGAGRKILTANMAGLWLKSYRLQTQVYNAMLARGYAGEPLVLDDFHARAADFLMLACAITLLTGTLWLDRFIR